MFTRPTASTKGILRPQEVARTVDVRRYQVSGVIAERVERCWSVHWDQPDHQPYPVQVVPHPSVNIAFTHDGTAHVYGVERALSTHRLEGSGWVFGLKFRPGGFHAVTGIPAAVLTDDAIPLSNVFGRSADALSEAVFAASTDHERRRHVEAFVRGLLPRFGDDIFPLVGEVITAMLNDRSVTRVADLTTRFGVSARSLQRLFQRYIGLGPKQVLRRYRLHDAAHILARGTVTDIAALSVALGYVDQAHFTRDFTSLVGVSPAAYRHACRGVAAGHGNAAQPIGR